MKRTVEITASFTGKIPTGSFENESPFFALKEIIEDEGSLGLNIHFDDAWIRNRQQELQKICYDQFKRHAEVAYSERIAKEYTNIRFYTGANGQKYPSVTSILNMDADFHVPPDELAQYGARGTVYHKLIETFLMTGEWKDPRTIPEIAPDVMTVLNGSLRLSLEDVDFRGFFKDYPFQVFEMEKTVINEEFKYGGRLDIVCVIDSNKKGKWDKIEGIIFDVPTILDIKTSTTLDKIKGLTQQAAYAKVEEVTQIGLIHLNKENVCGYSKPVITSNIESYWAMFLKQRNDFQKRYGV